MFTLCMESRHHRAFSFPAVYWRRIRMRNLGRRFHANAARRSGKLVFHRAFRLSGITFAAIGRHVFLPPLPFTRELWHGGTVATPCHCEFIRQAASKLITLPSEASQVARRSLRCGIEHQKAGTNQAVEAFMPLMELHCLVLLYCMRTGRLLSIFPRVLENRGIDFKAKGRSCVT